MTNTILETLSQLLGELTEKQKRAEAEVVECRSAVEMARDNLAAAKKAEEIDIFEHEKIKRQYTDLVNFVNGLPDKPQALIDKINSLTEEQVRTQSDCQTTHDIAYQEEQHLKKLMTRLDFAQNKYEKVQKDWKEVSEQIQRVNNL
jgi:hypothetical protein